MYKMITLPQLFYMLQNTYCKIPETVFATLNELRLLQWDGAHPRIALQTLQRYPYNGGLALPDNRAYYRAAHLFVINDWNHVARDHPTYLLERLQFQDCTQLHYIYGGKGSSRLLPATQRVLEAWKSAEKQMKWDMKPTRETTLWEGVRLAEIGKLRGFRQLDLIGISKIGDVIEKGTLAPFSTLQAMYQLHDTQTYAYLRLQHAWQVEGLDAATLPEYSPLEGRLLWRRFLPRSSH